MTQIITGSELIDIGYPEGKLIGAALAAMNGNTGTMTKETILLQLGKVKDNPDTFLTDPLWGELARCFIDQANKLVEQTISLQDNPKPYAAYGAEHIEAGAISQMEVAMRLPVVVAGALMPDAHQGYGLPIGGVLATRNTVIPYGVGVDIGCRMALTIYDIPQVHFEAHQAQYKRELIAHTQFGAGAGFHGRDKSDHAVLEEPSFGLIPFLKPLRDKAYAQLGSSGGGNHFVEWGLIEFAVRDEALNINPGVYLALLSHSGSRGLGATIAGHYTRIAKDLCKLPKEAANLAYLDLNAAEGQEYWIAMNLAGDYASACHDVIHQKLTKAIGGTVLAKVENHHNFAWKEVWNGEEVIVHRKGATPAGEGVMGIIPGSMTAPGFLVRGKGSVDAIQSASHGAGRLMSRTKALSQITRQEMTSLLKELKVTLIGGGLDEAPMAYKDIHQVMAAQTDLVDVVATFTPRMVRMASDGSQEG
jgi:tRNA-splicing ligase RtcB